VKKIKAKTVIN